MSFDIYISFDYIYALFIFDKLDQQIKLQIEMSQN